MFSFDFLLLCTSDLNESYATNATKNHNLNNIINNNINNIVSMELLIQQHQKKETNRKRL